MKLYIAGPMSGLPDFNYVETVDEWLDRGAS